MEHDNIVISLKSQWRCPKVHWITARVRYMTWYMHTILHVKLQTVNKLSAGLLLFLSFKSNDLKKKKWIKRWINQTFQFIKQERHLSRPRNCQWVRWIVERFQTQMFAWSNRIRGFPRTAALLTGNSTWQGRPCFAYFLVQQWHLLLFVWHVWQVSRKKVLFFFQWTMQMNKRDLKHLSDVKYIKFNYNCVTPMVHP